MKFFKVDFDRFVDHHANYYDTNGKLLLFGEAKFPPKFEKRLNIPNNLDEMIGLAEKLALDFPFVRVDLYNVNGHIYFGEVTFYPASGMGLFTPKEFDAKLGEWIALPSHE